MLQLAQPFICAHDLCVGYFGQIGRQDYVLGDPKESLHLCPLAFKLMRFRTQLHCLLALGLDHRKLRQ